jgi:hypothetical protein
MIKITGGVINGIRLIIEEILIFLKVFLNNSMNFKKLFPELPYLIDFKKMRIIETILTIIKIHI